MSNYITSDTELQSIAQAIRTKAGTVGTIEYPEGFVTAIGNIPSGGGTINVEDGAFLHREGKFLGTDAPTLTYNGFRCMFRMFDSVPATCDLSNIHIYPTTYYTSPMGVEMFHLCKATTLPTIHNWKVNGLKSMFSYSYIKSIPEHWVDSWDFSTFNNSSSSSSGTVYEYPTSYYGAFSSMFEFCRGLRYIPTNLTKHMYSKTTPNGSAYSSCFSSCYCLNKIEKLGVQNSTVTANIFPHTFDSTSMLDTLTFDLDENNQPMVRNWKAQIIDLSSSCGYAYNDDNILTYSPECTGKKISDATSYQALKNDPDSYTLMKEYSRYNHDSAVVTINSLPDCISSGDTNTIKFRGECGSLTDGGAISTLTASEIAVASAKGWTVTIV